MIYPQLVTYIKNSLAKNIPLEQVKKTLVQKGWRESDVNEAAAMATYSQPLPTSKPVEIKQEKPKKQISPLLIFGIIGGLALIFVIGFIVYLLFTMTPNISDDILQGASVNLGSGNEVKFNLGEEAHRIVVDSINTNSASITIYSSPITMTFSVGQEEKFDLNSDEVYDLSVKLTSITDEKADFYIRQINETICVESWECTSWTACTNSTQSRVCTDANACGTKGSKPSEVQTCQDLSCSGKGGKICTSTQNCTGSIVSSSNGNCCLGNCTEITVTLISCGANIDCLISAADNCSVANLSYGVSFSNSTWIQNTTRYYKIRGVNDEKCEFYEEITDATGNFTSAQWTNLTASNYTAGEITSMIQAITSGLIEDSGICRFTNSELEDYLKEVKNKTFTYFTDEEIDDYECTGDLYG
ncbi:MAG: hypothetical protein PHQ66_02190 [Candidatus Nanoarchaeia archaeon]|nr:hypothetical protein [Candidatus Nanoarchaeia archaeon]MDD5357819.1 hypothetical protein [Candidatus Nanoarchaeia archaeon]MDD5588738.1 hypothetical protein [Candidatus Nanoarchaeia archaeon]